MTKFVNDSVHWYMSELTSRIVAETGIPTDRFHIGKIMMQCMKDDPDLVLQVNTTLAICTSYLLSPFTNADPRKVAFEKLSDEVTYKAFR